MFRYPWTRQGWCWALGLVAFLSPTAGQCQQPAATTEIILPSDGSSAGGSEWAQSSRALLTPNMYGDLPGNRALGAAGFGGGTGNGQSRQISGLIRDDIPSNASFEPSNGSSILTRLSTGLTFLGQPIPDVPSFSATSILTSPFPQTTPILENSSVTQAIQNNFAGPNETATFNTQSEARLEGDVDIYNIFLVYDLVSGSSSPSILLSLPNPTAGGLAGRTKVSTDNNPLPRDRVIFNYDHIGETQLSPFGQDISRYCFGAEKTFLDGLASLEVRLPFASSVNYLADNGIVSGSETELGNLHLTLKALAYSGEMLTLSGGLGISLPTADDTRLRFNGAEVVRISNEAVFLTPFVAALLTPTERLFGQAWFQTGFDAEGNPVLANLDTLGLRKIGKLNDPNLLQLDLQLGYWLVHPGDSTGAVRGLAPFLELHFNSTITDSDSVSSGNVTVADGLNSYDEFNLSAGVTTQLGDNLHLTTGVTAPLREENDRFGDYQVGVRLNWFFGPTASQRAQAVSNY